MNKLYILGALALANVEAYIAFSSTAGTALASVGSIPTSGILGSYTYSYTADCIASGTLSPLGLNNIYHQYYSYAMTQGTNTIPSTGVSYNVGSGIAGLPAAIVA
jgi:hypothetical protein